MNFCFGDIVVVDDGLIGVVVKSFKRDSIVVDNKESIKYLNKPYHEVYVREYNSIKTYTEEEMQKYMVRHKYLNEEELEYQKNAME